MVRLAAYSLTPRTAGFPLLLLGLMVSKGEQLQGPILGKGSFPKRYRMISFAR
jgi:hypothetical protein